jgi:hypothetical protein
MERHREQRHHLSMFHYEPAGAQKDSVAITRVEDRRRHGRRLLTEE